MLVVPSGCWLSLSARRAWIEICYLDNLEITQAVALRKESVDRNLDAVQIVIVIMQSLSARRAWIEMYDTYAKVLRVNVALRKESVDRNNISANNHVRVRKSLSARRAWIEIS